LRATLPHHFSEVLEQHPAQFPKNLIFIAQGYLALNDTETVTEIGARILSQKSIERELDMQIAARVLLAIGHQARGNANTAMAELTTALTLAEADGYIRTFADLGPPLEPLLQALLTAARRDAGPDGPSADYIQKILDALQPPSAKQPTNTVSTASAQPLPEPLTDREMEVLQLLANGLSNREIAETLVISTGTVKVHTTHIYGKLDVSSRTQAVAKARSLRVLTSA
jgi:LuxR family maltose regulon positive regulatory protein